MSATSYVGVVIVNYLTPHLTAAAAMSLHQFDEPQLIRMVVVDNSADGTFESNAKAWLAAGAGLCSVDTLDALVNLGYGGGNNLGVEFLIDKYGEPELVIAMNPDTRVEIGSAAQLLRELRSDGDIFVAATKDQGKGAYGLSQMRRLTGRSVPFLGESGLSTDLVYPGGHFICIPFSSWRLSGGFSESLFLYGEELDLALRLSKDIGRPVVSRAARSVVVHHDGGGSTSTPDAKRSLAATRHAARSKTILYIRHRTLRPWLPLYLLHRLGRAVFLLLTQGPRACGAVLTGVAAGLSAHDPRPDRRRS